MILSELLLPGGPGGPASLSAFPALWGSARFGAGIRKSNVFTHGQPACHKLILCQQASLIAARRELGQEQIEDTLQGDRNKELMAYILRPQEE